MRRNSEEGSKDRVWAPLVWPSMGVKFLQQRYPGNDEISTEQRFMTPLLLEAIHSQGKSGSIHDFNGKFLVLLQCLALWGACGIWRKRWILQNKADWENVLHTRQIKNKKNTWACLLYTAVKGKGTGWKELKVPRKYCEQSSCFQCVSVTPSQSGQYVCSHKQKLLECYALFFTHFWEVVQMS